MSKFASKDGQRVVFPEDHPVELLRGTYKLMPSVIKRSLSRRAAWIAGKYDPAKHFEHDNNPLLEELKAIVQAAESIEEVKALREKLKQQLVTGEGVA